MRSHEILPTFIVYSGHGYMVRTPENMRDQGLGRDDESVTIEPKNCSLSGNVRMGVHNVISTACVGEHCLHRNV